MPFNQPSTNASIPAPTDIMVAGLVSNFQSTPLDRSEFEQWGPSYLNLINLQDTIGWDHFLRGKLSHEWAHLQQDYLYRTNPSSTFERAKWIRPIIKPLILACLILWTLRNEEHHGHDTASRQNKLANKPAAIFALSTLFQTKFSPPTVTYSPNPSPRFSKSQPTPSNAGYVHTNRSSTTADVKPGVDASLKSAYFQQTFILFPADALDATHAIAQFPQLPLHSASPAYPTSIPTSHLP
jgi:hypothetical protein